MTPAQAHIDHTLTALADPTRRAILHRLAGGEARVTELAAPFAMSLNAVSKHIRILERAHLVHRRIEGREHFLSVDPKALDDVLAWMERERAAWTARLDRLEALLRAEDQQTGSSRHRRPKGVDKKKRANRKQTNRKGNK